MAQAGTEVTELKLANRKDPGRPMTATADSEAGTLSIRLGDMGITDVTINLTQDQTEDFLSFLISNLGHIFA